MHNMHKEERVVFSLKKPGSVFPVTHITDGCLVQCSLVNVEAVSVRSQLYLEHLI